ncbi:MAG: hypothetical protein E7433_02810 [Ruminococcaceae bacterium]|nr:hypothetical protein [Oscillospiraceae bacterium]
MKRLFAILLILALMLCAAGCQISQSTYTKAEIAAKYGIEESVIDEWHNKYPKSNDLPPEDSEFAEDSVIICVYPFANAYEFTPEDFPELQCSAVYSLASSSDTTPTRLIILSLKDGSRQAVIDAIKRLQLRADVYSAGANYVISGD